MYPKSETQTRLTSLLCHQALTDWSSDTELTFIRLQTCPCWLVISCSPGTLKGTFSIFWELNDGWIVKAIFKWSNTCIVLFMSSPWKLTWDSTPSSVIGRQPTPHWATATSDKLMRTVHLDPSCQTQTLHVSSPHMFHMSVTNWAFKWMPIFLVEGLSPFFSTSLFRGSFGTFFIQ